MKKNYQTTTRRAAHRAHDAEEGQAGSQPSSAHEAAVALPDTVTVAIAELAGELEEGLLAFVVGAGLKVLDVILEAEATALAGPEGPPRPRPRGRAPRERRRAGDAGRPPGVRSAGLGCARADRSAEVRCPPTSWRSSTELLGREAMARMLAKLSTRRYGVGLEPVGEAVTAQEPIGVQVGGVAPLRGRHRVRAGRAHGGRPLGARPGGHHDRRGPFRPASVRRGPRDRHRRHQAPARPGRRRHRERHRRQAPAWSGCASGGST